MEDTAESFKIDIMTEIKDELQESKEMNKSLKTEVEDWFQNEENERTFMTSSPSSSTTCTPLSWQEVAPVPQAQELASVRVPL